jgi:hypothetical protein
LVLEQIRCIGADADLLQQTLHQARQQEDSRMAELDAERRVLERDLVRWHTDMRSLSGQMGNADRDRSVVSRLADLQERIDMAERRLAGVREQVQEVHRQMIDEEEAREALANFDPVWASLTLGAATAAALKLNRVRFYENGVVSVNLPYCTQVVGARASRTTHPRVLAGLTRLFTMSAKRPFTVENPFRDKTKADLVRLLANEGCAELIRYTRSCAHPRVASNSKPHCGVCSQCLDRRLAVLDSGQQAYDPGED